MPGVPSLWQAHPGKEEVRGKRVVNGRSSPKTHMIPSPPTKPLGARDSPFETALHTTHKQYPNNGHNSGRTATRSLLDRDKTTVNVCWPALFPKKKFSKKQIDESCTAFADFAIQHRQNPWSGQNPRIPEVVPVKISSEFIIPQGIKAPLEAQPKVFTPRMLHHPEDFTSIEVPPLGVFNTTTPQGSPPLEPIDPMGLTATSTLLAATAASAQGPNTSAANSPRPQQHVSFSPRGGLIRPPSAPRGGTAGSMTGSVGGMSRQGTPRSRLNTPRSNLNTPKCPMSVTGTLDTTHSIFTGGVLASDMQSLHSQKIRQLTKKLPTFSSIHSVYAKAHGEAIELDEETDKARQRAFEQEMISSEASTKAIGDFELMNFVRDRALKAAVMRDRRT